MASARVKATIAQSNTVIPGIEARRVSLLYLHYLSPVSSLPSEAERRRRLLTRTAPLAAIALLAFIIGVATGSGGSPEKDAANRFVEAWEARDFKGMYGELNDASKAGVDREAFAAAYREAEQTATARTIEAGSAGDATESDGAKVVPVEMTVGTVAFGTVEGEVQLP